MSTIRREVGKDAIGHALLEQVSGQGLSRVDRVDRGSGLKLWRGDLGISGWWFQIFDV